MESSPQPLESATPESDLSDIERLPRDVLEVIISHAGLLAWAALAGSSRTLWATLTGRRVIEGQQADQQSSEADG